MNSEDNLPHQLDTLQQQKPRSFNQLKLLALFAAVLLIAIVTATSGYSLWMRHNQSTQLSHRSPQATITQNSHNEPTSISMISPTSSADVSIVNTNHTSWKTFTAPIEGFTLRYPNTWRVEDVSLDNCGHKTGIPDGRGNYCKDSFNFIAPDRLKVRYVIYTDNSNDRSECGVHGPCTTQHVDEIETVNLSSLGDVLLVKAGKGVTLHKPIDSGTIPVIGKNEHSNYMIWFSLPAKTGGRFSLFLTTPFGYSEFDELTDEQYYNLDSVKQGIQILKSLKY